MKSEFVCPNCGSDKLLVREKTSYYLNTMEFFCHSVKVQDSDAKLICKECWCRDLRMKLVYSTK